MWECVCQSVCVLAMEHADCAVQGERRPHLNYLWSALSFSQRTRSAQPLPHTTLLILAAQQPNLLYTTLNNPLPPCPWATLNVGLTYALAACPPPKLNGRQFPWKPAVKVFFPLPLPLLELRAASCLCFLPLKHRKSVCVCVFKHSHICRVCMCCVLKGWTVLAYLNK